MGKVRNTIIWLVLLTAGCALIVWHVIDWQAAGKYDEMYQWLGTGKAYLVVIYNVGIMLATGLVLGLLMNKLMELIALVEGMKRK